MSSGTLTVSRQRYISDKYLMKEARRNWVKPIIICNWKSCRKGDAVFLENSRIMRDKEKIKQFVADKFHFDNEDRNFHLLENLEKDDLMKGLKTIANEMHTTGKRRPDVFICFLLGFGGPDFIYDIRKNRNDSMKIKFHHVMDIFNGTNCPGLVLRPKLFFIQTEQKKREGPKPYEFQHGDARESASMKTVPVESDFFVYSSTLIWEDDISPFVDNLKAGFESWSDTFSILDVTLKINTAIAKEIGSEAMPVCTCQLTKQLHFDFK